MSQSGFLGTPPNSIPGICQFCLIQYSARVNNYLSKEAIICGSGRSRGQVHHRTHCPPTSLNENTTWIYISSALSLQLNLTIAEACNEKNNLRPFSQPHCVSFSPDCTQSEQSDEPNLLNRQIFSSSLIFLTGSTLESPVRN